MAPPIRLPGERRSHQSSSNSWTNPVRQSWSRLKQVRGIRDLARWSLRSFRLAHLPLRIRPALVLGTFLALLLLSLLGFHPTLASHLTPSAVPWSDKLLHFICFGIATALFYSCWVVEEHARRVTFWRYWNELVSLVGFTLVGGIGSEFVQALLPYKSFQIGDVVANLLGSGLAVVVMHHYSRQARRAAELRTLYVHLDQISPEDDDDDDDEESGDSLDDDDERDRDQTRRRGNGAAAEAGLLRHQRRREMQESSSRGGGNNNNMRFARVDFHSINTTITNNTDSVAKRKQALDPWSATDDEIFGLGDDDDDDGGGRDLMTPPPPPHPPPSLTVTPPPPPPPPPGGRNPSPDAAAGPL